MVKRGFTQIGFVRNLRTYGKEIREMAGIKFLDFEPFHSHIESIWSQRDSGILCYDQAGATVSADSSCIVRILLDTGFRHKDSGATIYAEFSRMLPGSLDDGNWQGVVICTLDSDTGTQAPNLRAYSSGIQNRFVAKALYDLTGQELSDSDCMDLLQKSFAAAKESSELAVVEHYYDKTKRISFFPLLNCPAADGSRLFVKMEPNTNPVLTMAWYGAYILTESELKEELLSYFCYHSGYFQFNTQSDETTFYADLANQAMKETWKWKDPNENTRFPYPILKSYLEHTYYRLTDENETLAEEDKKIISFRGKSYFNSGLLNRFFRQIIIEGTEFTLEKEIPGLGQCRWTLLKSLHAYDSNSDRIAGIFMNGVPKIASYFKKYNEVVFDAGLEIYLNDKHIFEDGIARGRIPRYRDEYNKVKHDPEQLDHLINRIAQDFDGAKDRAKLMAERNYKLAIPQFYRATGKIQFLLPIYLGEKREAEQPQCALVLSLDESGRFPYYRGETILTLSMAYNNSRLIAKPDIFWLNELVEP